MKHLLNSRAGVLLATGLGVGLLLGGASQFIFAPAVLQARATAITNKDSAKFKFAYRQTIEGCYACHKACEKPFLRPQVPNAASVSILNFDPNATWPP